MRALVVVIESLLVGKAADNFIKSARKAESIVIVVAVVCKLVHGLIFASVPQESPSHSASSRI